MLKASVSVSALLAVLPSICALELSRYLLISAPVNGKVVYAKVGGDKTTHALIDSGLKAPQGLAIDHKQKWLFVADPDSKKIFFYKLLFNNGVVIVEDDKQNIGAQNVEARWVAVDGVGTIYFTDEKNNAIMKVSAENLRKGDPRPIMLYNGMEVNSVSAPGGIAVDNFRLFWSNKAVGTQVGSVARGYVSPPDTNVAASVKPIAKNVMKAYGVCQVMDNVYYTDAEQSVYAVKKEGGAIATITDKLMQPRGCAWDGDGTIFVADKKGGSSGGGAVYSFPGNMQNLRPTKLVKAVDFEDAFGVAVVSGTRTAMASLVALLIVAVAPALTV